LDRGREPLGRSQIANASERSPFANRSETIATALVDAWGKDLVDAWGKEKGLRIESMDVRRGPYASSDSGGALPRGILSPFLRDTSYAYATLTLEKGILA
jgi:hypothetical protein